MSLSNDRSSHSLAPILPPAFHANPPARTPGDLLARDTCNAPSVVCRSTTCRGVGGGRERDEREPVSDLGQELRSPEGPELADGEHVTKGGLSGRGTAHGDPFPPVPCEGYANGRTGYWSP